MNPTSVFTVVRNNLKRYLNTASVIIFGILIMYFITILMGSITYGMEKIVYEPLKEMSIVEDYDKVPKEDYNKIIQSGLCKEMLYIDSDDIMIDGLMGGLEAQIINFSKSQMDRASSLFDINIKRGTLPKDNNEIMIHQLIAKQLNLKTGDLYGTDINEEHRLRGEYKVSGVFEGSNIIILGFENNPKNLLLVSNSEDIEELNRLLNDMDSIDSVNLLDVKEDTEQAFQLVQIFAYFVMILIVTIVTLVIGNISYINFYDRIGEIALLYACGNSRKKIIKKLVCEMGVVLSIGGTIGLLLAILGSVIFNAVYCAPSGIMIEIISIMDIARSVLVILFSILLSVFPIAKFIKNADIIEVLEGNY